MPRARGRPAATRGIYALDDLQIPPPEIVVETTFVADARLPSQLHHRECRGFLDLLAGSTVYFNELLETELGETAYTIAIRELHGTGRKSKLRIDGRTRRRAIRLQRQLEAAWRKTLGVLDWVSVSVGEVSAWVPEMMKYGLASNDAVHAATAAYADVRAMATTDFGFVRVPSRHLEL
jgi:predicted nucleic acid-binding protein